MAAPDFLTWDGDSDNGIGPRRPSTDDLGGDNKLDDTEFPPDAEEHYTAAGWNQIVKQLRALAKVASSCKLEVRFDGGTPEVSRVTAPGNNITTGTFTVTDNAAGDTTIEWPAGTFPATQCAPTGLTLLRSSVSTPTATGVEVLANGIRVRTAVGGAGTDLDFAICIN